MFGLRETYRRLPRLRPLITLLDRPASVRFVKRDTARLDIETGPTELGRALVTSIEQTVLDLARRRSSAQSR